MYTRKGDLYVPLELLVPTMPFLRREQVENIREMYKKGKECVLDAVAVHPIPEDIRQQFRFEESQFLLNNGHCRSFVAAEHHVHMIRVRIYPVSLVNDHLLEDLFRCQQLQLKSIHDFNEDNLKPEKWIELYFGASAGSERGTGVEARF